MNYTVFSTILILGVIFVNGWTDAPNAITGCVCSGAISMRRAVAVAAICNFLGVIISWRLFPTVAKNIFEATGQSDGASICAALLSVILLAVGAWVFGIPTSESHAIVASITGAGFATGGSIKAKLLLLTLTGLIISVIGGFIAGYIIYRQIAKIPLSKKNSRRLQIAGACGMAFMHGAQDGQKFLSILLLTTGMNATMPITAVAICALTMMLGTATGGGRIINKVGRQMVSTDDAVAISSDIAGTLSLFISTVMGLPVSTTHAKTASVMGCGYATHGINKKAMRQMIVAWLITFPVCFGLGFIFTKLF